LTRKDILTVALRITLLVFVLVVILHF